MEREQGLLFASVSFEQMGEQSLTINATTDLMRSNGHGDVFSGPRIVEHYLDMIELMFCLRSKDQFDTIDCSSLPMFKEAAIQNLQVNECIWKVDSRMERNWKLLISERLRLHEDKYKDKVGYNPEVKCFVFRWSKQDTIKNLCWNCGKTHTPAFSLPSTVWGLQHCYQYVQ